MRFLFGDSSLFGTLESILFQANDRFGSSFSKYLRGFWYLFGLFLFYFKINADKLWYFLLSTLRFGTLQEWTMSFLILITVNML